MARIDLITQENAQQLWLYFCRKYNVRLKPKEKSNSMKVVGAFLERFGYMTQRQFIEDYYTTVKKIIFTPKGFLSDNITLYTIYLSMCAAPHEFTHIRQKIKLWKYIQRKRRIRYEIPAYCANIEMTHFLTGAILDPAEMAAKLKPYGAKKNEINVAKTTFRIVGNEAKKGRYKQPLVVEAIAFLTK